MDYNLAKQLKDAGFPQNKSDFYYATINWVSQEFGESKECEPYLRYGSGGWVDTFLTATPTLSELIEACGDGFKGLFPPRETNGGWLAVETVGQIDKDGTFMFWSFWAGQTPEEAVAKLWLSLNKARIK